MTPDDLDRIVRLAEATTKAIARGECRVDAHDAALEEMRKEMDTLQHEFVKSLKISLTYTDSLEQRISDIEERIENPTPPAVPDAAEDDRIELAHFSERITRNCESNDDWLHAGQCIANIITRHGLTPAPPPLVVTGDAMDVAWSTWKESNEAHGHDNLGRLRMVVDALADHWNANRDAAGDDQDDRPDVGGE